MVSLEEKIGHLKKLFRDIVLGFSVCDYAGKPIFIKHFSEIDNADIESIRTKYRTEAKAKGMQEEEEKKQILISENLWTEEKEKQIENFKKEISDLELISKNLIVKKQILQNKEKRKQIKAQLNVIQQERNEIFGFCLEHFVEKKVNEYTIFNSFFKDKNLQHSFFTEEEFDLLSENDLSDLIYILNNFFIDFSFSQVKRICASPFFMSMFSLSDGNAYNFFGKRICEITILQANMFSQGKYFKSLIESQAKNQPPSDVAEDPDKMIEWYESISNVNEIKADGVSYVGASREELERMAGGKAVTVQEFASKKGNSMTTKDFIEMHGL